jgi:hypothetical protein
MKRPWPLPPLPACLPARRRFSGNSRDMQIVLGMLCCFTYGVVNGQLSDNQQHAPCSTPAVLLLFFWRQRRYIPGICRASSSRSRLIMASRCILAKAHCRRTGCGGTSSWSWGYDDYRGSLSTEIIGSTHALVLCNPTS